MQKKIWDYLGRFDKIFSRFCRADPTGGFCSAKSGFMWLFSQRIRSLIVSIAVLISLGLISFYNAIHHPFVHDDIVFIQNNPNISHLNLVDIFHRPASVDQNFKLINMYYRPLLELVYRIEYKFFGLNPHGFHLVNVLSHILNGILVLLIFRKILANNFLSFLMAAFFIVHPIQSEAVACVSGISNLFVTNLILLSFLLYLISRKSENRIYYDLSLLVFFVSFFAKEQVIVFPIIILLFECCFYPKDLKINSKRIFGFWAVLFLFVLIRYFVLKINSPGIFESISELKLRILTIPRSILTYISILILPLGLHYYRTVDVLMPHLMPIIILSLVMIGAVTLIKLQEKANRGVLIFGLGWFLIFLLPLLNIIPLIHEYSLVLLMEHFLYLPCIGIFLFVLVIVSSALKAHLRVKRFMIISCLVLMILLTIKQNNYWRSEVSLFERTLQYHDSARVRILMAKAYYSDQKYVESIAQNYKAKEILEDYLVKIKLEKVRSFYLSFIKDIYVDLGRNYEALKNYTLAVEQYKMALKIDPKDGAFYNYLGLNYLHMQKIDDAIEILNRALVINPNDLVAKNNLAFCYLQHGMKKEAEQLFKEILTIDPNYSAAKKNLEILMIEKGK